MIGSYSSTHEVLPAIEKNKIDVLLSDIDMPNQNGLDFRKQWMQIPVCNFITFYPDYAAESFELTALDFIVKPLSPERFGRAMKRCEEYLATMQKAELLDYSLGAGTIFIKDGHTFIKVKLHDILYLEALKDYTLIKTGDKNYCVLSPISNLLKEENFRSFIRVHRSYAVQKHLIDKISPNQLMINDITIPIGRSYKESLVALKP